MKTEELKLDAHYMNPHSGTVQTGAEWLLDKTSMSDEDWGSSELVEVERVAKSFTDKAEREVAVELARLCEIDSIGSMRSFVNSAFDDFDFTGMSYEVSSAFTISGLPEHIYLEESDFEFEWVEI